MYSSTVDDRSRSKDVDSAAADVAAGKVEDDRCARNNDRVFDRSFSRFGVKDTIAKALRHRAELLATAVSLDDLLVKWREMIVWYENKWRVCVESFRQSTELRVRLGDRLLEANALLGELTRLETQRSLLLPSLSLSSSSPPPSISSASSRLSNFSRDARFCSAPPASSLPPLPSRYFDPFVESNYRREAADEDDDGRTVVISSSDSHRTFDDDASTSFPSAVSQSSLSRSSRSSPVVPSSSVSCPCRERFDRLGDDGCRDGDECREDDDCLDGDVSRDGEQLDESGAIERNCNDDINIVDVAEESRNRVFSVASLGASSSVVVGARRDSSSLSSLSSSSLSSLSSSVVSTPSASVADDQPSSAVPRSFAFVRYSRGRDDFRR